MYIDYEANMYKSYNSLHPNAVKGKSNFNNWYQRRYLINKIYSRFNIRLPEDYDLNTFRFLVFVFGSVGLFKKEDFTFYAPYSIESFNMYYNPYKIASRPLSEDGRILPELDVRGAIVDEDAVIIKAFDDYRGFNDLIDDYAESLANFDRAIKTALMNSNVNLVAFAKDKKQALEIQTAYAKATEGEPLVIMDKGLEPEELEKLLIPFTNHDTAGIVDKLLTSRRAVVNNFLTEIGIENANINKKERLNTDEVNANNDEVESIIDIVYGNLKEGFEKARDVLGIDMSIELNRPEEAPDYEAMEGGEMEDV